MGRERKDILQREGRVEKGKAKGKAKEEGKEKWREKWKGEGKLQMGG